MAICKRTRAFFEMIKVSHTVFALPFAVGTCFLAAEGVPDLALLGKVIVAVFFARTAFMAFNRLADHRLDAENPRTADRALPARELSRGFVLLCVLVSLAGFFGTAAWINLLALQLSPIVVVVLLGYSFTKRFTSLCHLFLGAALGLAPVGAWVAVRGSISWQPLALGGAVLLWTAGFDVIYACMDAAFDRKAGLFSLPARLGVPRALKLSALLHLAMVVVLLLLWWHSEHLGGVFLVAVMVVMALLIYEHRLVSPDDLSRVNRAFFTMNGAISFLLMAALIAESLLP